MANAEREALRCRQIEFLWRASHWYSATCPQLAAYWSSRLLDVAGAALTERLCPGCGSVLLPSLPSLPSPKLSIVSLKKLKSIRRHSGGRKGVWLSSSLGRARAYVLVSCVCGGSCVVAAIRRKPHPPTVTMKTPSSTKRRRSGQQSSTLRNMIERSRLTALRRKEEVSPSLSLFLTALNS